MKLNVECWKEFRLNKLYEIKNGNKFDKNKLDLYNPEVNLVSRVSFNNGVDVKVGLIDSIDPFEKGLLTVALGGSYLGSCFVQEEPFYTAQNVAVMKSIHQEMTHSVNLFVSALIRFESKQKFHAFGRELNTHINTDFSIRLPIQYEKSGAPVFDPEKRFSNEGYVPNWDFMQTYIEILGCQRPMTSIHGTPPKLNTAEWRNFTFNDVFSLKGGFFNKKPEHSTEGNIPFLASTESNNGVTELYCEDDIYSWDKIGREDNSIDNKIFKGNSIAITVNGSVCNAFYQEKSFTCSHDITVFYPKDFSLNKYTALFLCTIITNEKFRWSYGRKPHDVKKFGNSIIKLPIVHNSDGSPFIDESHKYSPMGYIPDFEFMEKYMKSLPYADCI